MGGTAYAQATDADIGFWLAAIVYATCLLFNPHPPECRRHEPQLCHGTSVVGAVAYAVPFAPSKTTSHVCPVPLPLLE